MPDELDPELPPDLSIAVIIPCYNEEVAIAEVVRGFAKELPTATVYVYDNNSTDRTAEVAAAEGAVVRNESRQGKGNVVRRMFSDVDADVFVMADGDATYDPGAAPVMIAKLLDEQLDMVVGTRHTEADAAYRSGHRVGNTMLTGFLARLFGRQFTDILSGYRVFSRRFVRTFPALAEGFETETELTVHALEMRMPVGEVATTYLSRPEGSESKLSTYRDGVLIAMTMLRLYEAERPRRFFGLIAAALALVAIILAIPIVITYAETGLVPRFPTAILSASLMLLAALNVVTGTVLETVTRGRRELKRMRYLELGPPRPGAARPPAAGSRLWDDRSDADPSA